MALSDQPADRHREVAGASQSRAAATRSPKTPATSRWRSAG